MKRTGGEWPQGTAGARPDAAALQLLAEEAKGEESQEHPLPVLASGTLSPCQAYPRGLSGWPWGRVNTYLGVLVRRVRPPASPCHPSLPSCTASCLSSLLTRLASPPGHPLLPGEGWTLCPPKSPAGCPGLPHSFPWPAVPCPGVGSPASRSPLFQLPHGLCPQHVYEPHRHPQPGAPGGWHQREGPVPPGQGQVAALLPQDKEGGWLAGSRFSAPGPGSCCWIF